MAEKRNPDEDGSIGPSQHLRLTLPTSPHQSNTVGSGSSFNQVTDVDYHTSGDTGEGERPVSPLHASDCGFSVKSDQSRRSLTAPFYAGAVEQASRTSSRQRGSTRSPVGSDRRTDLDHLRLFTQEEMDQPSMPGSQRS